MKSLKLKTTSVFEKAYNSKTRITVLQGGTRSSKTYSLAQLFLILGLSSTGNTFTICRKTLPALKATAYKDFLEILETNNLYSPANHNKTELSYKLNGNEYHFISIDMPSKVRGRKHTYLWLNEANEFNVDDYRQLSLRTTKRIYLDYNPSDEYHFIYDEILTRKDCTFIQSTYKDNPFLSEDTIKEIERLKDLDANYWRVYGLGERGISQHTIFTTYTLIDNVPDNAKLIAYGLDWGFTADATAIIAVYKYDQILYLKELLYKKRLTNNDIIEQLNSLNIQRTDEIVADSAEPKSIEELYRSGFNIKPSKKGADSINIGIDILKRFSLVVTKDSVNLIKELRNYKYVTDKNNKILNKPVDAFNHAIDAIRYVALNKLTVNRSGKYFIH